MTDRHREGYYRDRRARQAQDGTLRRQVVGAELRERNRLSAAESYRRKKERAACEPDFAERMRQDERRAHLRKKYGITPEDYDRMLAEQDGGCAACGAEPGNGYLHVDHDHATGEIRGLLCQPCNHALGMVSDSVDRLMSLAAYLLGSENVLPPIKEGAP